VNLNLGVGMIALAVLIFMLAVLFNGTVLAGHIGGVDWSITIPALPHPAATGAQL